MKDTIDSLGRLRNQNLSEGERIAAAAAGSGLMMFGLFRKSWLGAGLAALGGVSGGAGPQRAVSAP